jgi:NAD(P)H-flavin reductase
MPPKEIILIEIDKIRDHCESTKSFYFKAIEGKMMHYKAGQFMIAHIPREGKIENRAYSIASAPFETEQTGHLEICLNRVPGGYVSNWFHDHPIGTRIFIDGPYGNFIVPEPPPKDLIFCATGTGIVPFRAILAEYDHKNLMSDVEIWLFYGTRYESDLLYLAELSQYAKKYPKYHFVPMVSRPKDWKGEVGYVQAKLQERIKDPETMGCLRLWIE